ncbi:xylose isomerase [Palleronia aestuarii]|uniref:xylose isomerase n=1 Tax=Palleronia aestuarii TaxID=568105 RepID=A0A2W7MS51_9RHOB|nr:hypothetical protein [Palleronia aestuarii]PZX10291.1 xylose isomerase [Palleronia aestuarii]
MFHQVLRNGGFSTGGVNFDAKIRRQSIDFEDLLHAHVASTDAFARVLFATERMIADGVLSEPLADRYRRWDEQEARAIMAGALSLAEVADDARSLSTEPRSGRQEYLGCVAAPYV